jgi:hypothetical protein
VTKPGCVSTARWRRSGERDGEEYARNRRCKAPQRFTDSNLVDAGRKQRVPAVGGGELPGVVKPATGRLRGRSAAYSQRGCWGRVGLLLRQANSSEHGNRPGPARRRPSRSVVGLGSSSADRSGTGRSCRSTRSWGKPSTWGRAAAVSRSKEVRWDGASKYPLAWCGRACRVHCRLMKLREKGVQPA